MASSAIANAAAATKRISQYCLSHSLRLSVIPVPQKCKHRHHCKRELGDFEPPSLQIKLAIQIFLFSTSKRTPPRADHGLKYERKSKLPPLTYFYDCSIGQLHARKKQEIGPARTQ